MISEKVISKDQVLAEVFNKSFINIVPNLKIPANHNYDNDFIVTNFQVANALNKFRNDPSIFMIKNKKKIINFSPPSTTKQTPKKPTQSRVKQ